MGGDKSEGAENTADLGEVPFQAVTERDMVEDER
jgi:hypothetical protein